MKILIKLYIYEFYRRILLLYQNNIDNMHKDLIKFKQITNKEKLSQNTITAITQDKEGFMWFGSQDGLNRYDGYNFKIFKKNFQDSNSISENYIIEVFEDSDSDLWVGTSDSGLVLYDKTHEKFIKRIEFGALSNEYITSIAEDNDKNIWFGAYDFGLFKYNKRKNELEKVDLGVLFGEVIANKPGINKVLTLMFDNIKNRMYVGIWNEGLFVIDLKESSHQLFKSDKKSDESLLSDRIRIIFKDSNQNIWIGTQQGLCRFESDKNIFHEYKFMEMNADVRAICEDKKGDLWVGTYGDGLFMFNPQADGTINFRAETDNPSGFVCNTIFSLYFDRTDVLWIGTMAEGLLRFDSNQKKFFPIINRNDEFKIDERNKIKAIEVEDRNNIFIGTLNDGVYIYKRENNNDLFSKHHRFNKDTVYNFLRDSNNNLWVANETFGLSIFDSDLNNNSINGHENHEKENTVYCMANANNNGFLLIGTKGEGLKIYDVNTNSFSEKSNPNVLSNSEVRSIFIDSNNHLWVATHQKGLFFFEDFSLFDYNIRISNFKRVECDNTVWCIHEDAEGRIWIGTSSTGLNRIDLKNNKIYLYTEEKGLCNNCVHGILEDNIGNLWLSTSNGLSMFNKQTEKFKNFESSDGLNNLEFNEGAYFKHSDGTMYFGGNNGITYFHPSDIKDNPYIPNIVITEFEIFNKLIVGSPDNPFLKKNITYADEINLTYRESVFSFKFAALIFNNPQKNQYAYKMEGFDKDWTYSGTRRRVTYTNLDPGTYTFRVKGSNNDGIWNEEGTSIKINITPPYWKTWWFKGLGALSLIAATGISYRKRLEQMEKENKAQEEFSRKLIEAQENMKKRIAKELHDTIAHEVLISKQKAMMALKHKDDKGRMEKTLEEISDLSSATITEVRNIAYDLHPHQLDKLGFTKSIKSIVNEVSRSTNINFVLDADNVDEVLSKESEINLYRVVQETITNIIKHSGATEVILRVSRKESYVEILIVDNGKGFDVNSKAFDEARQGFGLAGIEERIKFMNGEINIESELNKGTTLKFKIPIEKL